MNGLSYRLNCTFQYLWRKKSNSDSRAKLPSRWRLFRWHFFTVPLRLWWSCNILYSKMLYLRIFHDMRRSTWKAFWIAILLMMIWRQKSTKIWVFLVFCRLIRAGIAFLMRLFAIMKQGKLLSTNTNIFQKIQKMKCLIFQKRRP